MPSLTLRNVPRKVHAFLRESAEKNRRSLNSEILARLERDIFAPRITRAPLAKDLIVFTEALPRMDHRVGDRHKRTGLKRSSSTPV